jgi:molecular chaperone HscB
MSRGLSPGAAADTGRRCWACGATLAVRAMFCHECGRLQPPNGLAQQSETGLDDAFARLGLARRFDIDPIALDRQYAGFSARLAADRFAARGAEEQAHAARHREALDQARAELADPWRRAVHLLALSGHPVPGAAPPDLSPAASAARAIRAEAARAEEVEPVIDAASARAEDLMAELETAFRAGDLAAAQAAAGEIGRQRGLIAEARLRRAELRGA